MPLVDLCTQATNNCVWPVKHCLCSDRPKQDYKLRLDPFYLSHQVRQASLHVGSIRSFVAWRPALNDIGNVAFLPGQGHRTNHFVQQLTGWTNKRAAFFVFFAARSFPNEHDFWLDFSLTKNGVCPGASQFARLAFGDLLFKFAKVQIIPTISET
jgi:hypothetical protein